jgi:DNA polymerase III sliding clamp (beta) subunit (PCNA family)
MSEGAASVAYSGVLLSGVGGTISAVGSDGENTITGLATGDVVEEGSTLVMAKPLIEWLRTVGKGGMVTIEQSGESELTAAAGLGAAYRFRTLVADFAAAPGAGTTGVAVDLSSLSLAIAAVRSSAGASGVVQLDSDDSDLRLCTTDTYRISQAVVKGAGWGTFTGLVPLTALEKVAQDTISTVAVDQKGRVLEFAGEDGRYSIRLSPMPFPSVGPHLALSPPHEAAVPLAELREALSRLITVSEGNALLCALTQSELSLSVESSIGKGSEEVAVVGDGDVVFAVNLEYLRAALVGRSDAGVRLGWSGPMSAVYLTSAEPLPITTIVMPVRVPAKSGE